MKVLDKNHPWLKALKEYQEEAKAGVKKKNSEKKNCQNQSFQQQSFEIKRENLSSTKQMKEKPKCIHPPTNTNMLTENIKKKYSQNERKKKKLFSPRKGAMFVQRQASERNWLSFFKQSPWLAITSLQVWH